MTFTILLWLHCFRCLNKLLTLSHLSHARPVCSSCLLSNMRSTQSSIYRTRRIEVCSLIALILSSSIADYVVSIFAHAVIRSSAVRFIRIGPVAVRKMSLCSRVDHVIYERSSLGFSARYQCSPAQRIIRRNWYRAIKHVALPHTSMLLTSLWSDYYMRTFAACTFFDLYSGIQREASPQSHCMASIICNSRSSFN